MKKSEKEKLFERMHSIGNMPINEKDEKWMQKAVKEPGSLHKRLGIPEEDKIPMERINSEIKKLDDKYKDGEKMSADDREFKRELTLAKTFKKVNEGLVEVMDSSRDLLDSLTEFWRKHGKFPVLINGEVHFIKTDEDWDDFVSKVLDADNSLPF